MQSIPNYIIPVVITIMIIVINKRLTESKMITDTDTMIILDDYDDSSES